MAKVLPRRVALVGLMLFLSVAAIAKENGLRRETLHFREGSSRAVVKGLVQGYETVDYLLGARRGQSMTVRMQTDNRANYYNILAPGENEVALFNSSMGQDRYFGLLPQNGEYTIRVYLMRSAARRHEVAHYRLEIAITDTKTTDSSAAPQALSHDALVPGTNYHATGKIPCAMAKGQPLGHCPFGVIREGGGTGTVTVTRPDGRTRAIFFERGKAIGADVSHADSSDFRASKQDDRFIIRIGEERYEIPDAVLNGG